MKKSKKLIAALLASLMVLSTAACSDGETQSSSSQQSGTNSSAAGETSSVETSDTGEEGTYDTHVDLSWYKEGITGHEINYDGDALGQFWQDKFNVTIDLTAATMDDSDWNERLRIWISSGDMPRTLSIVSLTTGKNVGLTWRQARNTFPARLWRRKNWEELMCCSAPSLPITGLLSG